MEPVRFALACLAMVAALPPAWSAESIELAVKAAYLVKFPSYVVWPRQAFPTPQSPVVLCVVVPDPFGQLLDDAAAGQQIEGRPLEIRRVKVMTPDANCHLAYFGVPSPAVDVLRGSGILVVTDGPSDGGIVHFVVSSNRVRFTVDEEAAAQGGLAISSKLLNVALAVKPRGGAK